VGSIIIKKIFVAAKVDFSWYKNWNQKTVFVRQCTFLYAKPHAAMHPAGAINQIQEEIDEATQD